MDVIPIFAKTSPEDAELYWRMTVLFPALGVAFAAFCVWLMVRFVNRRERWAKWVLAAVVGVPVLYLASFGPACWLVSHRYLPRKATWITYRPITWLAQEGPSATAYPIYWWARVFEPWDPETNPNNEPPSLLYWQPYDFGFDE